MMKGHPPAAPQSVEKIVDLADEHRELRQRIRQIEQVAGAPDALHPEDFYAYMLEHKYIFLPTGQIWPASSVNARLPGGGDIKPSTWLDRNRAVEQMTWAPGEPVEIKDRLIADGGWIPRQGCRVFNLYRAPIITPIAGNADRWLYHVEKLYGDDAGHIIRWLAHRVQKPADKINHALVLGGKQGIGKDTLLEPVKHAIGAWNFLEVSPQQVLGRFNGFLKSVILRVSEARDLGEFDRFAFYDHMKSFTAAPPDVLRIDEKHRAEYAIPNVTGVIITTNHKADGIYLPADDRRHFVVWSDLDKTDFTAEYWNELWHWYDNGGCQVVAHYLLNLDLAAFDPKAPPPQTNAFFEIVNASRSPEDAELADALDAHCTSRGLPAWPAAVTIADIVAACLASRLHRLPHGPQEQPPHPAPLRSLWLHTRPQPRCRGRAMARQRQAPGHLCPQQPPVSGAARGRAEAHMRPPHARRLLPTTQGCMPPRGQKSSCTGAEMHRRSFPQPSAPAAGRQSCQ